ncbi:cardiolipin synthase [Clostridium sp. HMP27]|uniref:cardiolipin synthase n=1 Tax=Clostridium sp. HMP27 TaxID=1487921 RepID=UPI00052E3C1E|nr:cardiolipin synthase [Clostridium sp. HMP27]KGK87757.1 hypothetical protein DP68_10810 [Clostridium sp. HMP27]
MKKLLKLLFSRAFLIGCAILVQIFTLVIMIWKFGEYFIYFNTISSLLSAIAVLWIINNKNNPAYKIAWIIPIMLFPIFGGLFYLMFGGNQISKRNKQKMKSMYSKMFNILNRDKNTLKEIESKDKNAANQARYIEKYSLCPVYPNSFSEYLTPGEMKFERLKQELKKAQKYIFLEYFIIEEGVMWNSILDILVEKVKQGVDVRVIYDDFGCLTKLPYKYDKHLKNLGIKCCAFNPLIPVLSIRINNRDHRKIVVIDGHTAFTGGVNLADEYINACEKYGHWKDSAIMIQGEAVWNFTIMFLSLWNYLNNTDEDYEKYKCLSFDEKALKNDGYILPFGDSPLDGEALGESVYMNLINNAKDYIYINTPYLILDHEMTVALSLAAKRGVDVKIVTPFIPDKAYVHTVTRSYYKALIESGVKIYEYTPGFIHAKSIVVDDDFAIIGTINLDYRSLYLHFECAVWMYKTSSILDIKSDFINTLKKCKFIDLDQYRNLPWYKKVMALFLRVFAPLM